MRSNPSVILGSVILGSAFGVLGIAIAPGLTESLSESAGSLADPVVYDFTVEVREGSLAGNRFSGTFRFDRDRLMGTGRETIGVADGLTVKMRFYGLDFAADDDVDYPAFPIVNLNDGEVESLDFWIEPSERGLWWDRPGWDIDLTRRSQ